MRRNELWHSIAFSASDVAVAESGAPTILVEVWRETFKAK